MSDVRDARGWVIVALVALLADAGGAVVAVAMIFSGHLSVAVLGVITLVGTALMAVLLWDMLRECWDDLQKAKEWSKPVEVGHRIADDLDRAFAAALAKQRDDRKGL